MIEIKGKFNTAKVFVEDIDELTYEQVEKLVNQEFTKDSVIRIMPDCHAGIGCVIGTTMTITDKVVPNLVGVDIGCGLLVVELGKEDLNPIKLDEFILDNIPYGFDVNSKVLDDSIDLSELRCFDELKNINYLRRSVGSLGSGNHFIEVDIDNEGNKYLVIHSGSRNLGTQVAEYYQRAAVRYHENKVFNIEEEKQKLINELKGTNHQNQIEKELRRLSRKKIEIPIPRDLAYLEGELLDDYLHDMNICQKYASKNREIMARRIVDHLNRDFDNLNHFETVHNYINFDDMILRKGAISANLGERVIIPINMRDGCIIGFGKGNKDYNMSAPHGAGRLMSRREAFRTVDLKEFQKSMEGIYSTSVVKATLDEAPSVYKPIEFILDRIQDTIEVEKIIKPIYNFKGR